MPDYCTARTFFHQSQPSPLQWVLFPFQLVKAKPAALRKSQAGKSTGLPVAPGGLTLPTVESPFSMPFSGSSSEIRAFTWSFVDAEQLSFQ